MHTYKQTYIHTYYLSQADFASLAAVKLLVGELTLLRADSKHALEQAAKIDAVAAGMLRLTPDIHIYIQIDR